MTLVLFIPHQFGFLIVSDRQDTHFNSNEKFEFNKLYLKSVTGPAIGSSGSTDLIRLLYAHLSEIDLTTEVNVCKKIQEKLAVAAAQLHDDASEYATAQFRPSDSRLEMLVLQKSEKLKLTKLSNVIDEPLADLSKIHAVPELNPEAKRYLDIKTSNLTEKEAIEVGGEILRQTSFGNFTIGPPDHHGYDVINLF